MKRRLSALSTPFWKFIFPAFLILLLIINLILDFGRLLDNYAGTGAPITCTAIGGNLIFLFISVVFYKEFGVIKRVDVDDSYLYVSNYLKEIKIPLSDVEHAGKPDGSSHQRIKIFLRSPSVFGDVLVFMPSFFSGKDTYEELQARLTAYRKG